MKIDGKWMMHCSKCDEWNDTHTTKYHRKQKRNAASFQVPEHHPWWLLSGKVFRAAGAAAALPGAGASETGTGSGGSVLGSLTRVVDRAMTSTESEEFISFLSDVHNALGN
jgi:hypothetical protein